MPKLSRTARRRNVAIEGAKILVTSAAVIATVGGWAAISAGDVTTGAVDVAQVLVADDTATTATPDADASTTGVTAQATVTPTATAAPTQAPIPTQRVRIRTRSSR